MQGSTQSRLQVYISLSGGAELLNCTEHLLHATVLIMRFPNPPLASAPVGNRGFHSSQETHQTAAGSSLVWSATESQRLNVHPFTLCIGLNIIHHGAASHSVLCITHLYEEKKRKEISEINLMQKLMHVFTNQSLRLNIHPSYT